jgi:hypothetical protein
MEPCANFEQRCDPATQPSSTSAWLNNPTENLQQSRLASAVPTNDSNDLTLPNFEADIPQRPEQLLPLTIT